MQIKPVPILCILILIASTTSIVDEEILEASATTTQYMATAVARAVIRTLKGMETSDGAGVKLMRVIGQPKLDNLDPFLLLDEFKSDDPNDYIAGFPDHPHRGFETVSYMLAGRMQHGDHVGNKGELSAGSIQWMTAGRGIIHSETPIQEDGLMWGFQLWVNLPAKDKMCEPRYQDIAPDRVPVVTLDNGVVVKVLAGTTHNVTGPVRDIVTQPTYLDIFVPPRTKFSQPVDHDHTLFTYGFEGAARYGNDPAAKITPKQTLVVWGPGDKIDIETEDEPVRLIMVSGKPLNEPIARHGPFVMNTREEIMQAMRDYQSGRLGGRLG